MKKLESSNWIAHFALPMPYLVLVFKMYASQLFLGRFPRLVQLPQREKPSTFKFRCFILYISLFLSLFSPKPSLNYRKYFHTLMPMLKTNFITTTLYLSSQLIRANKINTEESGISYKIFYLILPAMYFSLCYITIQLWKPKMISCNFWLCFNRGCNVYLVTHY